MVFFQDANISTDVDVAHWGIILPVMGIAAVVGGVLQVLYPFVDPEGKKEPKVTWKHILVSGFFGFGGGMAVLLAAIWVGKVPKSIIELVATGVVAGFIGYRILPKIARQLEERLSDAENEIKKIHSDIKAKQLAIETARQELFDVEKTCLIAKYRASLVFLEDLKRDSEFKELAKLISVHPETARH